MLATRISGSHGNFFFLCNSPHCAILYFELINVHQTQHILSLSSTHTKFFGGYWLYSVIKYMIFKLKLKRLYMYVCVCVCVKFVRSHKL